MMTIRKYNHSDIGEIVTCFMKPYIQSIKEIIQINHSMYGPQKVNLKINIKVGICCN